MPFQMQSYLRDRSTALTYVPVGTPYTIAGIYIPKGDLSHKLFSFWIDCKISCTFDEEWERNYERLLTDTYAAVLHHAANKTGTESTCHSDVFADGDKIWFRTPGLAVESYVLSYPT